MASKLGGDDEGLIQDLNLTPFIDVVLVLLIMFMIAAPAVYQAGVRVELPAAVTGKKLEHITLRFTLLADGQILLDGRHLAVEEVGRWVKSARERDATADAVVAADRHLEHGKVVALIDQLRQAGLQNIALGVELAAPPPSR